MKLDRDALRAAGYALGAMVCFGIGIYIWSDILVDALGQLGVWSFGPEDMDNGTVASVWALQLNILVAAKFMQHWMKL